MVGYGVDIHAPRPPFVLVKVLYRVLGVGMVVRPWWVVMRAVVRGAGWVGGYAVGGLRGGGGGGGGGGVRQPGLGGGKELGGGWSMMDDEVL